MQMVSKLFIHSPKVWIIQISRGDLHLHERNNYSLREKEFL